MSRAFEYMVLMMIYILEFVLVHLGLCYYLDGNLYMEYLSCIDFEDIDLVDLNNCCLGLLCLLMEYLGCFHFEDIGLVYLILFYLDLMGLYCKYIFSPLKT